MSRKTRKLIWSAPLVAVLAVVGALAIFAAATPGGLLAHGLPGVVANLTATADGYHTVNLGWDAPPGDAVDDYRIDRSLDGNTWVTYVTDHQGTTYTDNNKGTNLKAGTAYYYRVFAVNSAGTGTVSRDVTTQTDVAKVPEKVEGLSAQAVDQNNITVSWSAPASNGGSPIKNYEIHWNIDGQALPAADVRVINGNGNVIATTDASTSYTHEELDAGTRYRYQVYAVNGVGKATDSGDTAADVTHKLVKPGAPTGVTAVQTTDRDYKLYWYTPRNTGGAPVSRYKVQVSLNGSRFADADTANITLSNPNPDNIVIGATPTEQGTYDVPETFDHDGVDSTAVVAVTRVRFQVFAETGDTDDEDTILTSTSAGSTGTLTLLAAGNTLSSRNNLVPNVPAAVTAVRDGFKNVDLAWTAPATNAPAADGTDTFTGPDSIGGYRIDVSDTGVVWRSLIDHTRKADPKYKYVDTEVKVRYYRVFAWHSQYLGNAQANPVEGMLTTGGVVAPDHVSGLALTVVGPTQIDLSWTAPTNNGGAPISRYIIQTSKRDDAVTPPDFAGWPAAVSNAVEVAIAADGNKTSMSTSYSHIELSAGETWRYRVLAVNKVGIAELLTDEADSAEVRQGTTHQEQMPEAPEMLTAESAKSSSSPSATDRGVLLLWNAPSAPDGADIGGYRVQRMKDGGAWETLQSNTLSVYTNYTDSEEPAMDEMRGYRVAAISTNNREGMYSNVAYIPAQMHSHEPTEPTNVQASSDAAGELMLNWEGGANADSFLLIAVNMADTSDYKTTTVSDGAARMGTVAGLTSGVNYLGIVVALQGAGADQTYPYGASSVQAVQ